MIEVVSYIVLGGGGGGILLSVLWMIDMYHGRSAGGLLHVEAETNKTLKCMWMYGYRVQLEYRKIIRFNFIYLLVY